MNRQALKRATESADTPTPGYLYVDIAKSVAASPQACADTITYLTRRLGSKTNHNIKYKCLKVIHMLSQNSLSRGIFKRTVSQDNAAIVAIKNCLNFRGPPDPVRGDEIYARVRNQAKETLNIVYSDSNSNETIFSTEGGGNTNCGYGHNESTGGVGCILGGSGPPPLSGEQRKMEGIGNPMYKDSRFEQSIEQDIGTMTMKKIAGAAMEGFAGIIRDPLARNIGTGKGIVDGRHSGEIDMSGSISGYGITSRGWNSGPPGRSQLASATNGEWTMASNRGPNAIGVGDAGGGVGRCTDWSQRLSGDGVGGSWASSKPSVAVQSCTASHGITLPNPGTISGAGGSAASDGNYERNLIMELCPPGGMRAEPPPDKLVSFTQAISSLDPDLVCPALLDALEDGQPWIIRAKALCVMEVAINVAEENRLEGQNNAYADFFHACKEEIEPLACHTRVAVRDPSKRVLKALGIDVAEQKNTSPVASKGDSGGWTNVVSIPNLLDFDQETTPPSPSDLSPTLPMDPPPAPPVQAPHQLAITDGDGGSSLFGGMTLKDKCDPSSDSPVSTALQNFSTTLLDDLSNEPTTVEAMLLPATKPSLFVNGPNNMSICAASDATGNDVANESYTQSAAAASSNIGSSAFSFLDIGGHDGTFDPLLSVGVSSITDTKPLSIQQPVIAVNPQMASAYQQQMSIMQMQQMQISTVGVSPSCFDMQHGTPHNVGGALTKVPTTMPIRRTPVMGGANASGAATSFALMEDPAKLQKEASNKKFDFVQDVMKSAK